MPRAVQSLPIKPVSAGAAAGVVVGLPALLGAIASAGAGHGHYVAARVLFPASMLLTVFQNGSIGAASITVALLQFPLYGALLGWCVVRRKYLPAALVASGHVLAAMLCFSGWVADFS
jgi:hypothetical protein